MRETNSYYRIGHTMCGMATVAAIRESARTMRLQENTQMADIIKIVGYDSTRSKKHGTAMFDIYLNLSDFPPHVWTQIFEDRWKLETYNMKRDAWIEDNYIILHCIPEEVDKYHLEHLKSVVDKTNQDFANYVSERQKNDAKRKEVEVKETERLNALKGKLKFD